MKEKLKAMEDTYIFDYAVRNGSTKNALKSFKRYTEGIIKQSNQANRQAKFRASELEAQKEREALND